MPAFLENKLKARYGANSPIPYKIMNSIGAMHGNKVTPKGEEMERKHEEDLQKPRYPRRSLAGGRRPTVGGGFPGRG